MSKKGKSKAAKTAGFAVKSLAAVGAGALLMQGFRFGLTLFGPVLPYKLQGELKGGPDSDDFARVVSLVTSAIAHAGNAIAVLKNGPEFYPAELEAIRNAQKTIHLEYYEFQEGGVTREFLQALSERARAGVEVRIVVDAVGSIGTSDSYFDGLRAAGGCVEWYHGLQLRTLPFANNRTHRKLLIVDGAVAFIGGAGIADHWLHATRSGPAWRDTVFRVEGPAVGGLMSVAAENWLECTGEMLAGPKDYPDLAAAGPMLCLPMASTPHGGATRSRTLFQLLMDSACEGIRITTPYFLPDHSARHAMYRAVRRNVRVQVLTAGLPHIDHRAVGTLSRGMSLKLVRHGVEVFDYQPSMIHAKLMTVDGLWTVMGSSNFDHRSFALNDEVNMAVRDADLARRLDRDFADDLKSSKRLTINPDRDVSLESRVLETAGWLLRREE